MKTRRYKFQVFRNAAAREFYIHLRAKNGEIILPGEGFKRRRAARALFENLAYAFANDLVDFEELDAKGKPIPQQKFVGTLVRSKRKSAGRL